MARNRTTQIPNRQQNGHSSRATNSRLAKALWFAFLILQELVAQIHACIHSFADSRLPNPVTNQTIRPNQGYFSPQMRVASYQQFSCVRKFQCQFLLDKTKQIAILTKLA
mmetsp:Transcript_54522/g.113877  ORF Transcript_54522/g.113877 Transcript_54522/m.113877 type:complete len:110 (+) Transcript_54522:2786-3115(+)